MRGVDQKCERQRLSVGPMLSFDTNDDPENQWCEDLLEVLRSVDILFPKSVAGCSYITTILVYYSIK
jgi:hypothetical protein